MIARDSLDQALRFYDSVQLTHNQVLEAPERWPVYPFNNGALQSIRKRSVIRFSNYLIFYRMVEDHVEIIRVIHGARDQMVYPLRKIPPTRRLARKRQR